MVTKASVDTYEQKKTALLAQWREKIAERDSIGLQKESTNLFRHRAQRRNRLDVRHFNQIISIDTQAKIVEVEGMMTYEALVAQTLKHGLLPTVVPELKSITVGGAVSGIGIESSSFRYGLVHETIIEMDVLLADGKVVLATPDNAYSDLFYAFPNSYGTLGYAIRLKIKLVSIKPYIKLSHQKFTDANAFFSAVKEICHDQRREGKIDYVDGVVFSQDQMVLTTARFVDTLPYQSRYQYMKIYYRSLLKRDEDYLTTHDYIWRWDTDWFWCSKVFGAQNLLLRALMGPKLLKSTVYRKIMSVAHGHSLLSKMINVFSTPSESVIQDVCIPIDNAAQYFEFFNEKIGIKPFWICPIRPYRSDAIFCLFPMRDRLYVNFGFWDNIPSTNQVGFYNRQIEKKVRELGGNKSLYSDSFYTEDEFWDIYDPDHYQQLKQKYDPQYRLRDLYSKCIERN